MRFASGLFLQQAVSKGGAQLEGDGEITLPPVIQPVAEISYPLRTVADPIGLQSASFVQDIAQRLIGAQGLTQTDGALMSAGLWSINARYMTCHTGGGNLAKANYVQLISPVLSSVVIFRMPFVGGFGIPASVIGFEKWFSFAEDNWRFRILTDITVAGDDNISSFSYFASKTL